MTNSEILKVFEGLTNLDELNLPLNIKVSYQLARNKQILNEVVGLINKQQYEIYKQYGDIQENGDIKVPAEKISDLNKDLEQLMSITNNIEIIKIQIDNFGEVQIPFNILEKLLPIIEE